VAERIAVLLETRLGEPLVAVAPIVMERPVKLRAEASVQSAAGEDAGAADAVFETVTLAADPGPPARRPDIVLAARPVPETVIVMTLGAILVWFVFSAGGGGMAAVFVIVGRAGGAMIGARLNGPIWVAGFRELQIGRGVPRRLTDDRILYIVAFLLFSGFLRSLLVKSVSTLRRESDVAIAYEPGAQHGLSVAASPRRRARALGRSRPDRLDGARRSLWGWPSDCGADWGRLTVAHRRRGRRGEGGTRPRRSFGSEEA